MLCGEIECSCAMVENYLSAIKANLILFDLPFVKAHNLIDLQTFRQLSMACLSLPHGQVYKAVILTGFFAFMRLSNLAPHSLTSFDPTRHLTGHDIFFTKH